MSPKQSWYAWIEALVARYGTAKACAAHLEIDESKLSRWRRIPLQEPTATDLERLADRTRTPLTEILLMVWAATKARDEMRFRPQMGTAVPPVVPWPKPTATRRRPRGRKLAAWLCTAASALSIGWGYGTAHAQPVDRAGDTLPLIGHSPRKRRWLRWPEPRPVGA